jgi:hypothetical protein
MLHHRGENLLVGRGGNVKAELVGERLLGAQALARADAGAAVELDQFGPAGRVFRYSTTSISAPASWRMASVLRDVPQAGL